MKKATGLLAAVIFSAVTWVSASPLPLDNQKVTEAFAKEFGGASEVEWSSSEDVYIVSFKLNKDVMRAWYTADGEVTTVQRVIQKEQMTYLSGKTVLQLSEEQTILSIAEISKEGELYYLVKTENDNYKSIYRLSASGEASRIEKKKKK